MYSGDRLGNNMVSTVVIRYRFRARLTSAYVDLLRNESSPLFQTRTEGLCDVEGRDEDHQQSRRQRQFGEEAAHAPGIRDLEERHGLDEGGNVDVVSELRW